MADPSRRQPTGQGPAIADEHAEWLRESYDREIAERRERKSFVTDVGIPVQPLYSPADLERIGFGYDKDLGFPGQYPFTRGDRAAMYRSEHFVVSAYSGFGDAEVCNTRFKRLIGIGAEQILVALDL